MHCSFEQLSYISDTSAMPVPGVVGVGRPVKPAAVSVAAVANKVRRAAPPGPCIAPGYVLLVTQCAGLS